VAKTTKTAAESIEEFDADVLRVAWGSLSRAELDFLIFRLLVRSRKIDLKASDFAIANILRTTQTRVRALRRRFEQAEAEKGDAYLAQLLSPENFAFEKPDDSGYCRVQIASAYLREYFAEQLFSVGAIARQDLTPTVLTVPFDKFVKILVDLGINGGAIETQPSQDAYNKLVAELARNRTKDGYKKVGADIKSATSTLGSAEDIYEVVKKGLGIFGIIGVI
jgi:hypothetical protein